MNGFQSTITWIKAKMSFNWIGEKNFFICQWIERKFSDDEYGVFMTLKANSSIEKEGREDEQ